MTQCYYCGHEITAENESVEHIIPNACGGKLKSKKLLCKDCNSRLGHQIDKELSKQLNGFMVLLGATREKGGIPPINARLTGTNEEVRMTSGGKLTKRGAPDITPWTRDGKTGIDFVAHDHEQAQQLLNSYQRKFPNMVFSTNDPKTTPTYLDRPLTLSLEINDLFRRAILKIALNFYLVNGGKRDTIQSLLSQLEGTTELANVRHFLPEDGYYQPDADEVSHLLKLVGDPKERVLYCYVELFNATTFLVNLSQDYHGPALDETYVYDILTKKTQDKSVTLRLSAVQWRILKALPTDDPEMTAFRKRVHRLLTIAQQRDTERYKHALYNQCMAEAREGKIVTPDNYQILFMEGIHLFAERYAHWQAHRHALANKMAAGQFQTNLSDTT